MQSENTHQEQAWQENILRALYYAFAASDSEGRMFFLNLVLKNYYEYPSFLVRLFETIANIRSEGIFEISGETWAWLEFWQQFNHLDNEKIPLQIAHLHILRKEKVLSRISRGILHFLLALMEDQRGEKEAAVQLYEQSIHYYPNLSWAHNRWGRSFGNPDRHIQTIEKDQVPDELDPKNKGIAHKLNLTQTIRSLYSMLTYETRLRFIKRVFGGDVLVFDSLIANLELITDWPQAHNTLRKYFKAHRINPYLKDVALFSNFIYKRYYPSDPYVQLPPDIQPPPDSAKADSPVTFTKKSSQEMTSGDSHSESHLLP